MPSFVDLMKGSQISPEHGVKPVGEDMPPVHGTSEPKRKGSNTMIYDESSNYRIKDAKLACIMSILLNALVAKK